MTSRLVQSLNYMIDIFLRADPSGGTSKGLLTPLVVSTAIILIEHAFSDSVDDDSDFEADWSNNGSRLTSVSSAAAVIEASHRRMNELVQRTKEAVKKGKNPRFFWQGMPYPNIAGIVSASVFTKCQYHLPIIITFALKEACQFV